MQHYKSCLSCIFTLSCKIPRVTSWTEMTLREQITSLIPLLTIASFQTESMSHQSSSWMYHHHHQRTFRTTSRKRNSNYSRGQVVWCVESHVAYAGLRCANLRFFLFHVPCNLLAASISWGSVGGDLRGMSTNRTNRVKNWMWWRGLKKRVPYGVVRDEDDTVKLTGTMKNNHVEHVATTSEAMHIHTHLHGYDDSRTPFFAHPWAVLSP